MNMLIGVKFFCEVFRMTLSPIFLLHSLQHFDVVLSSRLLSCAGTMLRPLSIFLALHFSVCDVSLSVRSDGTGDFTSVQAALDSLVPGVNSTLGRVTLHLEGEFRERVYVYSNFSSGGNTGVTFIGASPSAAMIIYNIAGSSGPGTFGSFTATVDADGFVATGVAFANDADGYNKTAAGQSVALGIHGDRAALLGCALWGGQDTFYGGPQSRVYLGNTYINGSCDSLFGEGALVVEDSVVAIYDTITAQKGNGTTSYLFLDSEVSPGAPGTELGRPWGPLARTVFKSCRMSENVAPVGWGDWSKGCTNHSHPDACDGIFYGEYNSTGPGANPRDRAWWSRQLNASEAASWTRSSVLSGWDPLADTDVTTALAAHAGRVWRAKELARGL